MSPPSSQPTQLYEKFAYVHTFLQELSAVYRKHDNKLGAIRPITINAPALFDALIRQSPIGVPPTCTANSGPAYVAQQDPTECVLRQLTDPLRFTGEDDTYESMKEKKTHDEPLRWTDYMYHMRFDGPAMAVDMSKAMRDSVRSSIGTTQRPCTKLTIIRNPKDTADLDIMSDICDRRRQYLVRPQHAGDGHYHTYFVESAEGVAEGIMEVPGFSRDELFYTLGLLHETLHEGYRPDEEPRPTPRGREYVARERRYTWNKSTETQKAQMVEEEQKNYERRLVKYEADCREYSVKKQEYDTHKLSSFFAWESFDTYMAQADSPNLLPVLMDRYYTKSQKVTTRQPFHYASAVYTLTTEIYRTLKDSTTTFAMHSHALRRSEKLQVETYRSPLSNSRQAVHVSDAMRSKEDVRDLRRSGLGATTHAINHYVPVSDALVLVFSPYDSHNNDNSTANSAPVMLTETAHSTTLWSPGGGRTLCACVLRSGTTRHSGHFVAIVKRHDESTNTTSWYECNDHVISKVKDSPTKPWYTLKSYKKRIMMCMYDTQVYTTQTPVGCQTGFQNGSNYCFFNSTVQAIMHTPSILKWYDSVYTSQIMTNPRHQAMYARVQQTFSQKLRSILSPHAPEPRAPEPRAPEPRAQTQDALSVLTTIVDAADGDMVDTMVEDMGVMTVDMGARYAMYDVASSRHSFSGTDSDMSM